MRVVSWNTAKRVQRTEEQSAYIKKFEADLLEKVRSDYSEILDSINTTGKLEDEIKNKLVEVIESQKKGIK